MNRPHQSFLPEPFVTLIDSVKCLDARGLVYEMDYTENYYLLENYLNLLVDAGCTTFVTKNPEGQYLMGRNYDFRHFRFNKTSEDPKDFTGLVIVVRGNNPTAKYKSLGVADGFWMDAKNGSCFEGTPDDGKTDMTALAFAPFICMDGINEKGLAVSIMQLQTDYSWDVADYVDPETLDEEAKKKAIVLTEAGAVPPLRNRDVKKDALAINTADKLAWKVNLNHAVNQTVPGKKTVLHPVLMRLMLDNCATVEEAVGLASMMNVKSPMPDCDYHVLVTDPSGKSVVLEWVGNEMKTVETNVSSNYYLSAEDHYGFGEEREAIVRASFGKYEKSFTDRVAMRTLELAAQNPFDGSSKGLTQWSDLYNLSELTLKLWVFCDYDKTYEYKLETE